MRVLLIEDSPRPQGTVSAALRRSGYAVDLSGDGEDGLWRAENHPYDVIILDIMLPKLDGLALLQRLREGGSTAHVLLLTARDTIEDRVRGLRAGADDYLVKPFALEELLARVESLCRRAYGSKQNRLVVGDLEIDTAAKRLWRAGQPVALKPREYQLLPTVGLALAVCSGLFLSVTAAAVPRLLGRELAPLNRLADQAQQITATSLSVRFPTAGLRGELAPITHSGSTVPRSAS